MESMIGGRRRKRSRRDLIGLNDGAVDAIGRYLDEELRESAPRL